MLHQHLRKFFVALFLVFVLLTTSACATATQAKETPYSSAKPTIGYRQLERGNTAAGQGFGDWVVQASRGLVQDAYVRDNDKLGAVISSKVQPTEVRSLAKSLVQGFHQNAPNRDLTVLIYAPDKKLILTAKYNNATKQIDYQA
ncbi:MAG: hypothetical protein KME45_06435 [Stenomitos rutilans HA7619-LM2]|jgi:hypothetical protein|nr:hypothetical protein [Stenomitos rutilans HA7619-LM2]